MEKIRKLLLAVCLIFFCIIFLNHNLSTSVKRPANRYKGKITRIQSKTDKDADGCDDQTDVLNGALAYVQKRPRYKSKYYAGGYPDDGYGVCTDLVAAALKNAGYDLRELVDADIAMYPDAYEIDVRDKNIDYRRVKNLRIYFYHTGIAETMDLSDITRWQGGDIVIFENHIGIISDRRNSRGIPYVIHHNGTFQKAFEEDILESRNDIVAHYRISE